MPVLTPEAGWCADQAALPKSLAELLSSVDASKKQQILRRMSLHMQPILEKALLDPMITQRSELMLPSLAASNRFPLLTLMLRLGI